MNFQSPVKDATALESMVLTKRELGWTDGLLYYLSRGLGATTGGHASLNKFHLVTQNVKDKPLLPPGRGRDVRIREIKVGDPVTAKFPRTDEVIQFRYEQGATCLGAFKEDKFVGFHWLILNCYQEDVIRTRFHMKPVGSSAWNFDLYVKPEHRLGFTFPRIWDETHAFLNSRGQSQVMSRISAFNLGSVTSHLNMGATRLGWITYTRIGSIELMISSLVPRFYLSCNDKSIPDIHLQGPEQFEPR